MSNLNGFCRTEFWTTDLCWNRDVPEFSRCLQNTALVWIPCFVLVLFLPWEVHRLRKPRSWKIGWNFLNMTKLTSAFILCIVNLLLFSIALHKQANDIELVSAAEISGPLIQCFAQFFVIILMIYGKKRGLVSSAATFWFWLLVFVAELVRYYSVVSELFSKKEEPDIFRLACSLVTFPLHFLLLMLNLLPDRLTKESLMLEDLNNTGFRLATASYPQQLVFAWIFPLIKYGFKTVLTREDVWTLRNSHCSRNVYKIFNDNWLKSQEKCKRYNSKHTHKMKEPSIKWVLIKSFWKNMALAAVIRLFGDVIQFVIPIILNYLISFIKSDEPTWKGILYAVGILVVLYMRECGMSHYMDNIYSLTTKIKGALTIAVYRKALVLSNISRQEISIGSMVNLMSVDIQKFQDFLLFLPQLWNAPIIIALCIYQLWTILGPSCLAGLAVILLLTPVNFIIINVTNKLQEKIMSISDSRLKITNEILNGVKVLKLYAWEIPFMDSVLRLRNKEVKSVTRYIFIASFNDVSWELASYCVGLASFATYVLINENNVFTPNIAFVSIALFNIMKPPMMLLPTAIASTVEALVSIKRLNKYLNADELNTEAVEEDFGSEYQLSVQDGSFTWGNMTQPSTLQDMNFAVKPGELIAVVGRVGTGKSSFISALLGEMTIKEGHVQRKGSVAYVPQQAWIQNNTVQNNITFMSEYNQMFYNKVIDACALKPDFKVLSAGDQTEIGEKGVNLSGGQKQRISIARAVYNDADIYLFDDPLSAVDAHVGKHIFQYVIGPTGLLQKKTRVLATNALTFLPRCDKIIVLRDGSISETGTYSQLIHKSGAFADCVLQYAAEHHSGETTKYDDVVFEEILGDEEVPESVKRKITRSITSFLSSDVHSAETHLKSGSFASSTKVRKRNRKPVKQGQLVEIEEMETGSVKLGVYWMYMKQIGIVITFTVLIAFALFGVGTIASGIWLSEWSNDSLDSKNIGVSLLRDFRLGIYGGIGILRGVSLLVALLGFAYGHVKACASLHKSMLESVLKAPMSFFDTTPLGRINNRFSRDVNTMDLTLELYIRVFLIISVNLAAALVTIVIQTPLIIIAFIPLSFLYYGIQNSYLRTSRQLKRIEAVTRSPMLSYLSESAGGASSIRAYRCKDRFAQEFYAKVDIHHAAYYTAWLAARWLEQSTLVVSASVVFFTAMFSVLLRDNIDPGTAGLSVSFALSIIFFFPFVIQLSSNVETNIVSAERMIEYSNVPSEADWNIERNKPDSNWPENGRLIFNDYKTRYRRELDLVLKGIDFHIEPGQKIGVCGRTGAGKSSLTLGLFRIIEASSGTITLDSVDISQIGLHDLRSRLTIIPQDPVLFTGNLRSNLDPLNKYTDADIWKALCLSHLNDFVGALQGGLNHEISEGGENISVGQRQLICLARALLRKTKVLVLDEATAAVDLETDDLVQSTIRKEFADCTVITIAHRLNTIMDSNKVMLLSEGEIVEFDSPLELMKDTDSLFYQMVKDSGS